MFDIRSLYTVAREAIGYDATMTCSDKSDTGKLMELPFRLTNHNKFAYDNYFQILKAVNVNISTAANQSEVENFERKLKREFNEIRIKSQKY